MHYITLHYITLHYIYALRQLQKAGLAQHNLLQIYCSLIQPCIEYASPVWSDLTQNLISIIESVQKRALRIIFPSTSYEVALTQSGLETLENRQANACQMFADKMKSADHINIHFLLFSNITRTRIVNIIII